MVQVEVYPIAMVERLSMTMVQEGVASDVLSSDSILGLGPVSLPFTPSPNHPCYTDSLTNLLVDRTRCTMEWLCIRLNDKLKASGLDTAPFVLIV